MEKRREFVKITGEWEALTKMSLQMGARLEELEEKMNEMTTGSVCRICGCTDQQPCQQGCCWIDIDLCSECRGK